MPIEKFQISDLGPIKLAKSENLNSLNIIAGANGVGKSTLLDNLRKIVQQEKVIVEGTGKIIYISPYRTPMNFPLHKSLLSIKPYGTYIDTLARIDYYIDTGGTPVRMPNYFRNMDFRDKSLPDFAPYAGLKITLLEIKNRHSLLLEDVFNKYGGKIPEGKVPKDLFEPFRIFIKNLLPRLQFDGVELSVEGYYNIYFLNKSGNKVEFDQLSSGEKDIIAILFPFVEKKIENIYFRAIGKRLPNQDLVFLIDSPEAYLHPLLQKKFLSYLRNEIKLAEERRENLQIFIATHSATIINEAKANELYFMVFPDQVKDGNQIIKFVIEQENLDLIKTFLGDIGLPYLSLNRPFLLLEGNSDIEILRLLDPDIEDNLTLISLEGKGKILLFTEIFDKVIDELRKNGFGICAIIDKDREPPEKNKEYCFIWSRTCIENYLLLDSGVIYEALKVIPGKKRIEEKEIKSKENIEELIKTIIENSNTLTDEIQLRLKDKTKFYFSEGWDDLDDLLKKFSIVCKKKSDRLKKIYNETIIQLKEIQKDKEKSLKELSGKLILGKLAQHFGVRKGELANLIAFKMKNLNKTPSEITEILEKIKNKI